MEIRPARPADGDRIALLIRLLARFEKLPEPDEEAARRLIADAFEGRRLELWVAEEDAVVVAYAACFTSYSTFTALLARLRAEAEARGCGRFEWMVLDWNLEAQKLYTGIGATMLAEWRLVRIDLP